MDAKECRFCKHYQGLSLPESRKACMKHKKIKNMFDTCEDFASSGVEEFLEKLREGVIYNGKL